MTIYTQLLYKTKQVISRVLDKNVLITVDKVIVLKCYKFTGSLNLFFFFWKF